MNIKEYTGKQICEMLDSGNISILEELGAPDLKKEMNRVGAVCCFFIRLICKRRDDTNLRKHAKAVMKIIAPAIVKQPLMKSDDTVVIGFNHPSLGEVCRLLHIGFDSYSDKQFLFPVNLPWYESMVSVIPQLKRMGIRITPMMTPATEAKLSARFADDPEKLAEIEYLQMIFDRKYIREIKDITEQKGAIFVAPSATRQKEIIGDYVHPSMTVLAHLVHKRENNAVFLPVAVISPVLGSRELNLFRFYRFIPCDPFYSDEVKRLTAGRDREFDFTFLKRIEKVYKENT